MTRLALVFFGLFCLWSAAAPLASAAGPDRFASVAAVSEYNEADPELTNLLFATNDMVSLKQALEAQGYTVLQLQNAKATATNIRDFLRGLRSVVDNPKDATVVFSFSGHGFAVGNDNFLATYGATSDDIQQKGLAMREVKQLLEDTGAQNRVAFIDVCRGDPYRKHGRHKCVARNFTAEDGTAVLYSASPGQLSYDDPALRQGRFAHFLVRGLRGEAAREDGVISWENLKNFTLSGMRAYPLKYPSHVQTPWVEERATGDVLIGKILARP
jgi:uncharacterized caspase-like protein